MAKHEIRDLFGCCLATLDTWDIDQVIDLVEDGDGVFRKKADPEDVPHQRVRVVRKCLRPRQR